MRLTPLLLPFVLAACDKPTKPVADTPSAVPTPSEVPSAAPVPSASAPAEKKPAVEMPADASALAASSNAFAVDLWAKTKPGNQVVSPASIAAALAMTYGGARGDTAAAMKKTLHLDAAPDAAMTSWGTALRSLASTREASLRIANRLFGEKTYTFDLQYLTKTKDAFDAPLEPLDFKGAADASRAHINAWTSEQTKGKVPVILPPGALNDKTRLVLVNAIYFYGEWQMPFEKQSTSDEPFSVTPAQKKNVAMMHASEHFDFFDEDGASIVRMPYKASRQLAMVLVVPQKVDGLAALESGLTAKKISRWASASGTREEVQLALPKFEIDPAEPTALKSTLEALGMGVAFDEKKADFSGIARPADPNERVHVDAVFHKAYVKVDEKGTEAAAATAVEMAAGTGMPLAPPKVVRADRPFLFFLVDRATGLVLFMGRVADPTSKG